MSNPLSLKTALSNAVQKLDSSTLLTFLPIIILQSLVGIFYSVAGFLGISVGFVLTLARCVAEVVFRIIKTFFSIKRVKNEPISLKLITCPLTVKILLNSLFAIFIVMVLSALLIAIPFLYVRWYTFVISIAAIIYLMVRVMLFQYFIIDKNMHGLTAIKASIIATRWQFWKLLGALCILLLMGIGTLATLGIGGIWLIPLANLFAADIYKQLSSTPEMISYIATKGVGTEFHLS